MKTLRIFFCIFAAGMTLYAHVKIQNELTELSLVIPDLSKEVKTIQTENMRLHYEIERFESPIHLMELSRKPEYSHLKYPYQKDIIILEGKDANVR